jgi:hypothetical protein
MKKLFFFSVLALAGLILHAQQSYVMFETMYLDVKPDKQNEFEAAFKAHNQKFHSKGPDAVQVHYIVNGPWGGQLAWVMGPLTFTDLDNRPSGEDHEADWNKVMPFVRNISEVEYWKMDANMHYQPEGMQFSKLHLRFFDVKPGKWQDIGRLLGMVVKVYQEKNYPNSMNVYWNQFNTGNGRTVVAVEGFNKYSEYDKDDTFVADFNSVHGDGAWAKFMQDIIADTNGMTEELREVVPELGGSTE